MTGQCSYQYTKNLKILFSYQITVFKSSTKSGNIFFYFSNPIVDSDRACLELPRTVFRSYGISKWPRLDLRQMWDVSKVFVCSASLIQLCHVCIQEYVTYLLIVLNYCSPVNESVSNLSHVSYWSQNDNHMQGGGTVFLREAWKFSPFICSKSSRFLFYETSESKWSLSFKASLVPPPWSYDVWLCFFWSSFYEF